LTGHESLTCGPSADAPLLSPPLFLLFELLFSASPTLFSFGFSRCTSSFFAFVWRITFQIFPYLRPFFLSCPLTFIDGDPGFSFFRQVDLDLRHVSLFFFFCSFRRFSQRPICISLFCNLVAASFKFRSLVFLCPVVTPLSHGPHSLLPPGLSPSPFQVSEPPFFVAPLTADPAVALIFSLIEIPLLPLFPP